MQFKYLKYNNRIPLIIFLTLLALYILFGYGVTISNDSVTNMDQITALDLWSRSSHFSFHLFGIIFYLLFSKLIGLSAVTSIEIMLALFGTLGALSLYHISLLKYKNISLAITTVIIYSVASGIFRFTCQVEYLILVPSFGLLSLYLYSREKYLFAGILFGFGLLTSPFAILIAPMFFLFISVKKLFTKSNLIFILSIIIVYFAINFFTYEETVSGHWSYSSQVDYYKEVLGKTNFLRPISILVYGYLRSFNILLFVFPFVIYSLFKSNRELFYILLITLFIHLPVALPEARYGGYQMTAYPIIAVAIGCFFNDVFQKKIKVLNIILVLYVLINICLVLTERTFYRDLKNTYVQLNDNLPEKSVLIVYQAIKPIRNIYATDLMIYDVLSDYQNKLAENYPGYVQTDINEIIRNNDIIYLLESGVSIPDDQLKLMVSEFTKNQGAKVKGFAIDKILRINPSLKLEKLEGYNLDVYKLTKKED